MPMTTVSTLQAMKSQNVKISMLALYDATFAHAANNAGVEVLLIGDSLGMVLQGRDSTVPVTSDDIVYHTQCVDRGNTQALIVADLPFCSSSSLQRILDDAVKVMQAGAHMVKIESGNWMTETIVRLNQMGIPVCAHLGLTPQAVNMLGGFKVQGRDEAQAHQLHMDAIALVEAGAAMLVLECVPSGLAAQITAAVNVPVIGIGAGAGTDGQVLVVHDILGLSLTGRAPKFVKNFMQGEPDIHSALTRYVQEVRSGEFPSPEHQFV